MLPGRTFSRLSKMFSVPFSIEPTPTTGAIRLAPPLASIVPGCV